MPDWLIEGDVTVYLILVVAAIIAAAAWQRTRKNWLLAVAGLAALGVVALFVLDRMFESDREQIGRKVNEMAAAVAPPRNMEKLFANISADFRYGPLDKPKFREICESQAAARDVRELKVWDMRVNEVSRPRKRAEATFQFKIHATGAPEGAFYKCDATFVLDADNQWRLLTFKIYALNGGDPLTIPGVG